MTPEERQLFRRVLYYAKLALGLVDFKHDAPGLFDDCAKVVGEGERLLARIEQEAGASAAVPRPQDWLRPGVVDDCTNCHTCDVGYWWEPSGNVGPFCDTCADLLRRAVGQPPAVNAVDPVDRSGHRMTTRDRTSLSSSSCIPRPETETER